jgi:DUF1365 family protein
MDSGTTTGNNTATGTALNSCIYRGTVGHQRRGPSSNAFEYSLFMLYLDLDEIDTVFDSYWLWSAHKPAIARFRRADHYGDAEQPLRDSISELVQSKTGRKPSGPIRLLTHLSYFGHCFNPLSVYYCFNDRDELQDVVLEVSNTPWGEQHCYVLSADDNRAAGHFSYRFAKDFHVSPFLPMDMEYRCRLTPPDERLYLALDNYRDGKKVFGSHIALDRKALNHRNMALTLATDPLMTLRVTSLIHWQALKLWWKRAPFFSHPDLQAAGADPSYPETHNANAHNPNAQKGVSST